jgi:cobalt/nickel transport system permease protein
MAAGTRTPSGSNARPGVFVLVALAVVVVVAFVISGFASSSPDGLERVAADKQIDAEATDHAFADGPLADYAVEGVENERLSTGVAGVLGVAATLAVATGLFLAIRRSRSGAERASPPVSA